MHDRLRFQPSRRALGLGLAVAVCLFVPGCSDGPPPDFAWQAMQEQLPGALLSVWGTSATNVYAVGADALDGGGPLALRYDGQRWARLDTGLYRGALWWVYGPSADAVWMVGEGGVALRHNPTTGAVTRTPTPGRETLFGVWGAASNDVWAVGGNTSAGADERTGVLWHWDGTAWRDVPAPGDLGRRVVFYKVWGTSARDVWVCGSNSTTLHFDGNAWRQVDIPVEARGPLFTVHGRAGQRYAVGGNASGIILEESGNGWRAASVPEAPRLNGVYVPEVGAPVAVGQQGTLYLRSGGQWREVARPPRTDQEFHAVWVDPTGAVWAVGGNLQQNPMTQGSIWRFGTAVPTAPVVTPPEMLACPAREGHAGVICTVAGTGFAGYNGDRLAARSTELYWPMDLNFLRDGTPLLIDWNNHLIRRLNGDGTIETVVGTPLPGDGPPDESDLVEPGADGLTVAMNHPTDLLLDPMGRMLIVAWHNHKIRRWDPATGRVFVPIGRGPGASGDGGPNAMALLRQPSKARLDRAGNLYILDQGNGRIRRARADGTMETITSPMGGRAYAGDGGPVAMARFNWQGGENPEPEGGMALSPDERHLYLADTGNQRIRRIDLMAGTIESVIGTGRAEFGGDGGPGAMASLNSPNDLEFGPDGALYIADTNNHRVRRWDPATGVITTVAGTGNRGYSGDRGPAAEAQLWRPFGLAFDAAGNLWISDTYNNRVRRVWR